MINFFSSIFGLCVCVWVCVQMGKMKGGHTIYYLQFIHFSNCGFHLFYYDIFSINFLFREFVFLSIFTENDCVCVCSSMIKSKSPNQENINICLFVFFSSQLQQDPLATKHKTCKSLQNYCTLSSIYELIDHNFLLPLSLSFDSFIGLYVAAVQQRYLKGT